MSTVIAPGSDEWLRLATASKVAAILNVSKWDSPRSMWHQMRGDVPREEATKVQSRGHYLEPGVLNWFFDQHPELQRMPAPGTVVKGRYAATPDAIATITADGQVVGVEAKTAAEDEEWGTAGTDEIPVYYAAQCVWTADVLGLPVMFVPMLTERLEFREYIVHANPDLAAGIRAKVDQFLASIDADTPPVVDAHPATYQTLRKVNPLLEDGTEVQLTREQAAQFAKATREAKAAERALDHAKATIAELMGTKHKALYGQTLVARRQNTSGKNPAVYAAKNLQDLEMELS